jgi:hypothetical protein
MVVRLKIFLAGVSRRNFFEGTAEEASLNGQSLRSIYQRKSGSATCLMAAGASVLRFAQLECVITANGPRKRPRGPYKVSKNDTYSPFIRRSFVFHSFFREIFTHFSLPFPAVVAYIYLIA